MTRMAVCWLIIALVGSVAFADPEAPAEPEKSDKSEPVYHCTKAPGRVAIAFKPETDLKELVAWAMGFTCKNFAYDPSYVQRGKKVNLITPNELSADDAYQVFLVALSTMGFAIVPSGKVTRIVESATARAESVPLVTSAGGGGEQIVRYILRPAYAQPQQIAAALGAMKSQAGDIQTIGSVLLVTDFASHLRDMLEVVKIIDVPGGTDGIYTIPVQHADATGLAKEIEQLLATPTAPAALATATPGAAAAAAPSVPPKILVDARTNTLLVAASQAGYERVAALVARIDIPIETESGGQLHIYQLKSAIATEVAKTLNDAISTRSGATTTAAATAGQTAVGGAGAARPATSPSPAALANSTNAPGDSLALEGQARVIADPPTNKLIVMSTGRDFVALKHVIDELDEPRREVYIETVIVDLDSDELSELGVSSHGTVPTGAGGGGIVLGGVQTGTLSSISPASSLANATGLIGGVLGNAVTAAGATSLLGTSFPSYGVLFQALATTNNSTAISAPSIIALDNEDAKYSVGKTIPIKKGVLPVSSTNPSSVVSVNIDNVDLTLDLDIKPHISDGDDVLLEVKHSQKEEAGQPDPVLGPSWNTRTIETRVLAHDQQTVMLTGLTQVKDTYQRTRVPLLGDLPIIGALFSYTSKEKIKTNLVILLTPYIIHSKLDIDLIRQRHQREQDEFIGSLRDLQARAFQSHIDYGTKRGLLEEINRASLAVDDEIAARAALKWPARVEPGAVISPVRAGAQGAQAVPAATPATAPEPTVIRTADPIEPVH